MEIPTTLFYSKACKTILKTYSVKDFKNTFQDKYKVTLITLTEALLLPYCHRLIDMFLFCRVLPYACNHSEDFWKKKSTKTARNFQKNIWSSSSSFFMPKQQPRPQSNTKKKSLIVKRCAGDEVGQNSCMFYL